MEGTLSGWYILLGTVEYIVYTASGALDVEAGDDGRGM